MRNWSQAAVLAMLLPALGEAQMGLVRSSIISPYESKPVQPESFQNSQRIFDLIRAGQLYLSLADAIAMALENNLDIELERYLPRIAHTDTWIMHTISVPSVGHSRLAPPVID